MSTRTRALQSPKPVGQNLLRPSREPSWGAIDKRVRPGSKAWSPKERGANRPGHQRGRVPDFRLTTVEPIASGLHPRPNELPLLYSESSHGQVKGWRD